MKPIPLVLLGDDVRFLAEAHLFYEEHLRMNSTHPIPAEGEKYRKKRGRARRLLKYLGIGGMHALSSGPL